MNCSNVIAIGNIQGNSFTLNNGGLFSGYDRGANLKCQLDGTTGDIYTTGRIRCLSYVSCSSNLFVGGVGVLNNLNVSGVTILVKNATCNSNINIIGNLYCSGASNIANIGSLTSDTVNTTTNIAKVSQVNNGSLTLLNASPLYMYDALSTLNFTVDAVGNVANRGTNTITGVLNANGGIAGTNATLSGNLQLTTPANSQLNVGSSLFNTNYPCTLR